MSERPIYMISVAADLVGMHPQTLRIYESKGLVRPKRTPGGTRLYSEVDVERLRVIQRLTTEVGLNLAGVELVLRLEDELRKAHEQIERLQRRIAAEVQEVHRHYRRDLVLRRRGPLELADLPVLCLDPVAMGLEPVVEAKLGRRDIERRDDAAGRVSDRRGRRDEAGLELLAHDRVAERARPPARKFRSRS